MSGTNYALYTYFRSSCSARLRIALNLKNLSFETIPVNLVKGEQLEAEHKSRNPSGAVPLLVPKTGNRQHGFKVAQSVAAMEYLDEVHPEVHPLLPPASEPERRAVVRELANVIACDIQPVTNLRIMKRIRKLGGNAEEWNKELMTEGMAAYEAIAKDVAGKYSVGDEVTLADICFQPAIWNCERFGVDLSPFPTVLRIAENLSKHPAVIKAHWQNQPDTPETMKVTC